MRNLASTGTSTSTLPEQTREARLVADIMNDLETGQPMLLASTEPHQGDLQVVTLTEMLAKVAEGHTKLDQIAQLAIDYEAATNQQPAEPGHHPWCQPGACFVSQPDDEGEYVDHEGPIASVRAPRAMPTEEGVLLRARLCSDASDGGGASVSITGSNGNGTLIDGAELDTFIADLAGFLNQLRAMRPRLKAATA